ncbi:MAG: insulinase family protein, partial [Flavobacterium sp.]|nr:insulinase family protein [Flavobacterium sp.]
GSKYISTFKASTQVRNAVTDSAVVEFLKEFKRIRTEKVSDEVLSNVKAGYIGKFVMQIEKPQTVAGYALRIKTQNLPEDFYENYIKSINAVTSDDVLAAANKYFLADNTRIVIVGKGSEVLKGLERLKIPIFYFDKFGNPTEKPKTKTEVAAGVTVKTVLENYFKAIGGENPVKAIKTISMTGSAVLPQAPLPLVFNSKKDISGKSMVDVSMTGMGSMMKQVVNEKGAYSIQQGQRKELSGQDLFDKKAEATTFEELLLINNQNVTLEGIEPINGSGAYIIKNGLTRLYYDVKSGLKVAENTEIGEGDKKMIVTKNYSDYRDLNAVKFPYELIINQGFELDIKISEIKINEGVSDKDFE